jgi:murein DD-endopeptidase MepM/ murein hydrolase activator NlpD
MHVLAILTALVISVGCSTFSGPGNYGKSRGGYSGPGKLKMPGYKPNGGDGSDDESEDSELPPEAYIPSNRGEAKGYKPKHPFAMNWPLNSVKINQPFKPQKKRRPHLGVDFAGTKGTPIFAAHEGLVVYAGRAFRGFGKMVIVEYDGRWASLYAHMDKISVKQGQVVERGQTVGLMGRTGRATGVHLHFELLYNQRPVDPIPLLNENERLVNTDPIAPAREPASL